MTALTKPKRIEVAAFLEWAASQDAGRYELVDGEVVAMSPERSRHVDMKMHAWEMLRNAVRDAGLPCFVKGDGMSVTIDEHNSRQPDVSIQCSAVDPEAMVLDEPLLVVEVVSPSSGRSDTGTKVAEYFRIPSIRHYLIIDPYGKLVVRMSRKEEHGAIETSILASGVALFDPPGFSIDVDQLLNA